MWGDGARTLLSAVTTISGMKSGFNENTSQTWGEPPLHHVCMDFEACQLQRLAVRTEISNK
jgi:hypothetical protein